MLEHSKKKKNKRRAHVDPPDRMPPEGDVEKHDRVLRVRRQRKQVRHGGARTFLSFDKGKKNSSAKWFLRFSRKFFGAQPSGAQANFQQILHHSSTALFTIEIFSTHRNFSTHHQDPEWNV
jgi:hypothetical protein